MSGETRTETDSLGNVEVPSSALYGAQTQRAYQNFPVSGLRLPRRVIRALALIKKAAAEVNRDSGKLEAKLANAICQAAHEVAAGQHDDNFVVDIFQTGSGTSSNMNTNEVISNRAIQILGGVVDEAVEYLEEGERREWKRDRQIRLVPGRGVVWAARGGVAALVVLVLLLLVFAVNTTGWFGHALP